MRITVNAETSGCGATRIIVITSRRVNDRKQQQLVVFLFPKQLSSTATAMDIYNLYMGEGYGSMRNPVTFRDYEKHPYGSWEKTASNKGSYYQQQQNKAYSGGHSWKRPSEYIWIELLIQVDLTFWGDGQDSREQLFRFSQQVYRCYKYTNLTDLRDLF